MSYNGSNMNDSLKEIHTTFDGDGSVSGHGKKGGMLPKIMSVLAAIALWLYVFQAVEYEKQFNEISIDVKYDFDSGSGLGIVNNYPLTVDVTLSGTKSSIDKIKSGDIKAFIDIKDVYEAGTYDFEVMVEGPANAQVIHQSIEEIRIEIDRTVEKSITDFTVVPNYVKQQPFEIGEAFLTGIDKNAITELVLSGPETDLVNIEKAVINLDLGNVKNTVDSNINTKNSVTLYDAYGNEVDSRYITIKPASVGVHIPVYKSKQVPVIANIQIDSKRFSFVCSDIKAEIYGLVNDVDNVSVIETVDMAITGKGIYMVDFKPINDGITVYKAGTGMKVELSHVDISVTENEVPAVTYEVEIADASDISTIAENTIDSESVVAK